MKVKEGFDEGEVLSDDEYKGYSASRYTATGNEADIEDNIAIPSTPTSIMISERLREKPPQCSPVTPCRLLSAREEARKNITLRPPSTSERLTYRPKSAIETIIDTIKRPRGAVPPLALPNWHSLPLEVKIPRIRSPAGLMYYSPGKVSVKLHRKTRVYDLLDPYNRERVVGSPYTALHDPHAKDFINRPITKQLLYNQGLINRNNEVIYSLREFNKYRDYLRTVHSNDVHESVHDADELWRKEQEQLRTIIHYWNQEEGKDVQHRRKVDRIRAVTLREKEFIIASYRWKQQQREAKLIEWTRQKQQLQAEKIVRNSDKGRLQKEKHDLLLKDRERLTAQLYHHSIMKNLHCMERRNHDALRMKEAQENHLLEWMQSKINHSKKRLERYNRVDITCRESIRINGAKRQRRMETCRRNLPLFIAKKKELEAHRFELLKKYFYIWLEKVRRNTRIITDPAHESSFIRGVSGTLEATVKYLKSQTDTEKLDTFIWSIINLKNDIKRQIEREEAEEEEKNRQMQQQAHGANEEE